MIGDHPECDIRGANQVGWKSILVKTGSFKGKDNDPVDHADFVVENIG